MRRIPSLLTDWTVGLSLRMCGLAYNEPDWVLKDINFTIEPGEVVAFVGATGAGKTSITSLINRLYDIQKGQLLIDGVDIRKYKVSDLRRNIAAVLQDVFLFTGDIKSNIRLNNEDIPDREDQRGSPACQCRPFHIQTTQGL